MKKLLSLALISAVAFSFEFQPLGFRSIGMGGAGVANASRSVAAYYNPALLAFYNYKTEISLAAGIGYREYNLLDPVDKLANTYELDDTIDKIAQRAPASGANRADGTDKKAQGIIETLKNLSNGNNDFEVKVTAVFSANVKNFALGVYGLGDLGASAIIDPNYLDIIVESDNDGNYYKYDPYTDTYTISNRREYENSSIEYAVDNGIDYIYVKGLVLQEVPLSYGYKIDDNLAIGVNLKYIQGTTYKTTLKVDDDEVDNSLDENSKVTSQLGVDLGLLYKKNSLRAGVVGKYLNSPEFEYYDGEKIKVKPQFRAGIAYDIKEWLTFAMDMDLKENENVLTSITGNKYQYIGGGFDFHPASWFSLRVGAMNNIKSSTEGLIYTAGLGLGLKWFQFDLAAEVGSKTSTIDGEEVPRYAKVNIAIVSRWGGN